MKNSYVKSFNHWALNEAEEAEGSLLLNLKSGSGSNLETGKPLQVGKSATIAGDRSKPFVKLTKGSVLTWRLDTLVFTITASADTSYNLSSLKSASTKTQQPTTMGGHEVTPNGIKSGTNR